MGRQRMILVAAALATTLGIHAPLMAQDAGRSDGESGGVSEEAFQAIPDTRGDGPYPSLIEVDDSLADHVIYRPANLGAMGDTKLAVMVWGNGGCRPDGTRARLHLSEVASYGYLVIAPGGWRSGPGARLPPAAPRVADENGNKPPPATSADDVAAGIDWAIAQNADPDSPYFGRVDTDAIAVGGHSCGGLQAIDVAADPRIKTALIHNSGIFNGGRQMIDGLNVDKAMLGELHTPVLYVLGGDDDIAWPNGTDDVSRIAHVPVTLLDKPYGHGGTFRQEMGGEVASIAVDWLQWQLRGDEAAGRSFAGENCRYCNGYGGWTITRKNWP